MPVEAFLSNTHNRFLKNPRLWFFVEMIRFNPKFRYLRQEIRWIAQARMHVTH